MKLRILRFMVRMGMLRCEICAQRAAVIVPCPKGYALWCDACAEEARDILQEVLDNMEPDGKSFISATRRPRLVKP